MPSMNRKLQAAKDQSESVEKRLPQAMKEMENASKEYKRGRQKVGGISNETLHVTDVVTHGGV
jgi:predicted  nucleic acid-binding Zn-ribbon protein